MTADQENPTVWPDFMGALEPEASESPVAAAAPADIAVLKPSSDLPASVAAWSGDWSGWAGQGRSYDVKLIVESLTERATIVCVRASGDQGVFSERVLAQFAGTNCEAA